jgi:hypothetical protein
MLDFTESLEILPSPSSLRHSIVHKEGVFFFATLEETLNKAFHRFVCHRWPVKLRGVAYKTWKWTFSATTPSPRPWARIDPKSDLVIVFDCESYKALEGTWYILHLYRTTQTIRLNISS